MNVAIREQDRDLVVFISCPSNTCSQQDGWPETRSPSRQRAVSIRHRSGDRTLHYKHNAVEMFLLIGRTGTPQYQNFSSNRREIFRLAPCLLQKHLKESAKVGYS
jgi:hypothetical protein